MSISIRKLKHRPWPVTVRLNVCGDDGTVVEVEQTFIGHFNPFTEADLKAIFEDADKQFPLPADGGIPPLDQVLAKNAFVFRQLLCGWSEVTDEETGEPIPYTAEALDAWVQGGDGLAVSTGFNAALSEIRFGLAPAKNSNTSPEVGQPRVAGEVSDATSRN